MGFFTLAARTQNQKIFQDRALAENCFGRVCSFELSTQKWR